MLGDIGKTMACIMVNRLLQSGITVNLEETSKFKIVNNYDYWDKSTQNLRYQNLLIMYF